MNRVIDESQYVAACRVAGEVLAGTMNVSEGAALLAREHGLNETSARIYINDYRYLMEGRAFQRSMSAPAMRHFLTRISEEHGRVALSRAVKALWGHIRYWEGHYTKTPLAMRQVASDFEVIAAANEPSVAEIERGLDSAVARSMQEPRDARLARLATSSKAATPVTAETTVFRRNADVIAEVLWRAAGRCERCECEAPFVRAKDETPYLEVHHKLQLARGGEDSVDNAIALCPNCHREAHHGPSSVNAN